MTRATYIKIPAMFVGTLILSVVGIVIWVIALVPVMIYPPIANAFAADRVTTIVTKKMMQSARKNRHASATAQ